MLGSYDAATRTQLVHNMMQHKQHQHGGCQRGHEQRRAPTTVHSTLLSVQSRLHGPPSDSHANGGFAHKPRHWNALAASSSSPLLSSTPLLSSLPTTASFSATASGSSGSDPDDPDEGVELPLPLPNPSSTHWQHAVSAMGAGAITAVFTSPFDVIRTRLAVQRSVVVAAGSNVSGGAAPTQAYNGLIGSFRTIYREEGVRGLFRGFGPTIIVVPSFWAIYFTCYNDFKTRLNDPDSLCNSFVPGLGPSTPQWARHILAACSAGAVADVIVNPLFIARTRMQTQHMKLLHAASMQPGAAPSLAGLDASAASTTAAAQASHHAPRHLSKPLYTSTWNTLSRLVKEDGFMSLFRGVSASFLGLSHVALQFPLYEQLKISLPRARKLATERRRTAVAAAAGGPDATTGAAASSSASASSPANGGASNDEPNMLDLIGASSLSKMIASALTFPHEVLRARMQHAPRTVFSGLRDCATKTVQQEGAAALYKGFSVNLIRTVPGAALTLVSYEMLLNYFTKTYP